MLFTVLLMTALCPPLFFKGEEKHLELFLTKSVVTLGEKTTFAERIPVSVSGNPSTVLRSSRKLAAYDPATKTMVEDRYFPVRIRSNENLTLGLQRLFGHHLGLDLLVDEYGMKGLWTVFTPDEVGVFEICSSWQVDEWPMPSSGKKITGKPVRITVLPKPVKATP